MRSLTVGVLYVLIVTGATHAQFAYFPLVRINSSPTDNTAYGWANAYDAGDVDQATDEVRAFIMSHAGYQVPAEAAAFGNALCMSTCYSDPQIELTSAKSMSLVSTSANKDVLVTQESQEELANAYGISESNTEWEVLRYPENEEIEIGNLNAELHIAARSRESDTPQGGHPYANFGEIESSVKGGVSPYAGHTPYESYLRAEYVGAAGWSVSWKQYDHTVFSNSSQPTMGTAIYPGDFTKSISTSHYYSLGSTNVDVRTFARNSCEANTVTSMAPTHYTVASSVFSCAAFSVSAYLEQ